MLGKYFTNHYKGAPARIPQVGGHLKQTLHLDSKPLDRNIQARPYQVNFLLNPATPNNPETRSQTEAGTGTAATSLITRLSMLA